MSIKVTIRSNPERPPRGPYPAAVDFQISHHFQASPTEVATVLLDRGFQDSLSDIASLAEREVVLQNRQEDGTVLRRIRCVLDLQASGAAKRFLGDQRPAWIEEATWDPKSSRWDWTIHPEVARDLLKASGQIAVHAEGRGATRTVSGRVKVAVPLYGSKVEGWIVSGLEEAYEEEAERLTGWLKREN